MLVDCLFSICYDTRLAWIYLEIWVKDSDSSDSRGIRLRSRLFNSDCMYFTAHQFNDCGEKNPRICHNAHLQKDLRNKYPEIAWHHRFCRKIQHCTSESGISIVYQPSFTSRTSDSTRQAPNHLNLILHKCTQVTGMLFLLWRYHFITSLLQTRHCVASSAGSKVHHFGEDTSHCWSNHPGGVRSLQNWCHVFSTKQIANANYATQKMPVTKNCWRTDSHRLEPSGQQSEQSRSSFAHTKKHAENMYSLRSKNNMVPARSYIDWKNVGLSFGGRTTPGCFSFTIKRLD